MNTAFRLPIAGALAALLLSGCAVSPVSQPSVGYYGAVQVSSGLTPDVWNSSPTIAVSTGLTTSPLYLYVPEYQRLSWASYCSVYGACSHPVYFVREPWYRNVYLPHWNHKPPRPHFAPKPVPPAPPHGKPPVPWDKHPGMHKPPVKPPAVKPPQGHRPGVKPPMVKPPQGHHPGVKPPVVKPPQGHRPGVKPPAVKPPQGHRPGIKPPMAKPPQGHRPEVKPPQHSRPAAKPRPEEFLRPQGGAQRHPSAHRGFGRH